MIITEFELRARWYKAKDKTVKVPRGSILTPGARDFLTKNAVEILFEDGERLDLNESNYSTHMPNEDAAVKSSGKPEHMTHLRGSTLINKTDPIIAMRGQLDLFQSYLVEAQIKLKKMSETEVAEQLEEVAAFGRAILAAEVKNQPFEFNTLLGYTPEQLREVSHNPQKYIGVGHSNPDAAYGEVTAMLQYLRAKSREVELYANRAFTDKDGKCLRTDLIQALNRLSSALYIMAMQARARYVEVKEVPIGVSNRHVHLTEEHVQVLFGSGYQLTVQKELSQFGQYAAKECVTIEGPKGRIEKVRVLGPVREETQIEVSVTDCFKLGIKPVVRDSGDTHDTPGVKIIGPLGEITIDKGVMVASRHIHMRPEEAEKWHLKNRQHIKVFVDGERGVVYDNVLIRVNEAFCLEMHLDTDEANAAMIQQGTKGRLVGV